jgi:putative addiction module component (TIGR02574 family)
VTNAAETLLEQALTLPVHDRALLASGLLASLDSETLGETEVEALWSAETERRAAPLEAGHVEVVSWDSVVKHIDELRS